MIETTLFAISLVVILTLLIIRSIEIKRNRNIISESLRERSDNFVLKIWNIVSSFFSGVWSMVFFEIKKGFKFLLHIFVSIWEFFVHKSAKYIDMIRGRGVINNRGSASYFTSANKGDDLQN